ncbi:helix-turn-helix domain-containing protein [Gordonia sp. zg691]|uniref:GlxA family transcriptional regulator n=1 Tax=Gordonia jinghuaiqii TaxID=2758710 RepID=UPI0016626108|nr:helix-turn-helix domain-containing protein [Gordonia jinghuaiqii]MBD0860206.1 helix-turn-helix domain-containing protein [Gordonia jinghuaiqii]
MNVHRVTVLALESVLPIDLGIPTQIFNPRPDTPYALSICGITPGAVRTSTGFTIGVTAGLEELDHAGTIIIPGYSDYRLPPPAAVSEALNRAARRGARIASICTGAFALAAAGLLDGRTVTTHWASADELEELFPGITVDREVLYIDDTPILTSAGVTAGIDLCMHMVRNDLGAHVANTIARELVAAPHRDGGQAQYITRPLPDPSATTLAATREWAASRLGEPLTLDSLAQHAGVSSRTLTRLWRAETGVSPHRWLLAARVNRARELLEKTDHTVEQVASRCGLGSATNLRARFREAVGTTPTAYRRAFSQSAVANAPSPSAAPTCARTSRSPTTR